jgi:hypothetical protein
MVLSSALIIAADGECLTCGGFFLGEIVHVGSFEFIADYFGDASLSPSRGDSDAAFIGSTHSGTPSPWWAMIEDYTDKFLTVSSGEVGSDLPSSRRHGTGALPAPITTTP